MKAIVSSAVLIAALSVLSGCSNDPTSEDFKEFAEGYAKQVGGDVKLNSGIVSKITCKLVEHDLRKTDSLTLPFEGTAKFNLEMANLVVYGDHFPGKKTEATYHNRVELTFAWNGDKWVDRGGTSEITRIDLPSIPKSDREKYGDMHGSKKRVVSPKDSYALELFTTNGYVNPQ